MKRILVIAAVALLSTVPAAPAVAQFAGMPVWNSPKGGTGVTISGDMGLPNDAARKGTAFGARASVGLAKLTLTGGLSTWTPESMNEAITSFGGSVAYRVIGGSLMPIALNVIGGAARSSAVGTGTGPGSMPATTFVVAGAGVSAGLPIPGLNLEPYVSVTNRWSIISGDTDSKVGVTFGANMGFGLFGLHLAYDTMSSNGTTQSIVGIGAHVSLRAPLGM